MENRRHKRRSVQGNISGRMVHVEHLEILDISLSGLRCNCLKNVSPNSLIMITVTRGNVKVKLKGVVVRSVLRKFRKIGDDTVPIYEVAMTFGEIDYLCQQALEELIRQIDNE